jgi:2-polyprenyl-3-methyl-5-hydroxy-6-metoxy-1,4-benzoquinol methylase
MADCPQPATHRLDQNSEALIYSTMACPYCQSAAAEFIAEKYPLPATGFENPAISVVRCEQCDLYYSTPLPERFDQMLHSFFEDNWESEHRNNVMDELVSEIWRSRPIWQKAARQLKRLLGSMPTFSASRAGEALRIMMKLNPRPKTLLDIGTSYGGFVRSARLAGIDAYGIDPHHELVRRLNAYGVGCISQGVFGGNAGPLGRYDALTLLSVVNHLPAITPKFFQDCAQLLNPGGRVIICDVDPELPFVRQDTTLKSPISFSYLTAAFMKRAASDAGLSYERTKCQSEPIYAFHTLTKRLA